jgi:predicted tellurium resistance membrane protein TerC
MDWLTDPNAWIGLLTLTVLEIVLGVDNIIFIPILAGKPPRIMASTPTRLVRRVLLADLPLLSIAWVVR